MGSDQLKLKTSPLIKYIVNVHQKALEWPIQHGGGQREGVALAMFWMKKGLRLRPISNVNSDQLKSNMLMLCQNL